MKDSKNLKLKKPVTKCSECGLCKAVCPIFRVCLNEYKSPRGKAILRKALVPDSVFFDCTLCLACQEICPLNIDFEFLEVRKILAKSGMSPEVNKEMLENIKNFGNPFGKITKGEKPKKLYCC